MNFQEEVRAFVHSAQARGLRMLMVGGGAVNLHGYRRHSADVDFWVEPTPDNFGILVQVLQDLGYEVDALPGTVLAQEQNITLKISPDQSIELITRFDPGCSFQVAWERSEIVEVEGVPLTRYRVLGLEDLIASKLKAARPKDLLDVQELRRRRSGAGG